MMMEIMMENYYTMLSHDGNEFFVVEFMIFKKETIMESEML
jgi:hypothetical protein